jgi:hypothetical protein
MNIRTSTVHYPLRRDPPFLAPPDLVYAFQNFADVLQKAAPRLWHGHALPSCIHMEPKVILGQCMAGPFRSLQELGAH